MKQGPRRHRRLAAAALGLFAASVLVLLDALLDNPGTLFVGVAGLGVLAAGGWLAITEPMPRRGYGAAAGLGGLLLLLAAVSAFVGEGQFVLFLCLAGAGLLCARLAIASTLHAIDLTSDLPVVVPQRPVLICNPTSGGGKVAAFDIVARAQAMGVEVVLLHPGMDLEQLANDAVARGADCLGMAGGDGSLAAVARIAVAHRLPFVCICAGTRNHFAADVGLDRGDPAQGLLAFRQGVLRDVDYGAVGDRLFLNNVSVGLYASIVEQEGYRDAKLATAWQSLPELAGPQAAPFDLQFTAPDGEQVDGPLLVLVSNNPYTLAPTSGLGSRKSLAGGRLGVIAVDAPAREDPARRPGPVAAGGGPRLAAQVAGVGGAGLGGGPVAPIQRFTVPHFEVRSRSGSIVAGIDGEAVVLPTPLRLRIVPQGLRLLVPHDTIAATAHRRYRQLGVRGLWDIARGREPDLRQVLRGGDG